MSDLKNFIAYQHKPTEESLRAAIQKIDLIKRLDLAEDIIGNLCSKLRCPSMTIPVQAYDEDCFMGQTLKDAIINLKAKNKKIAELELRLEEEIPELENDRDWAKGQRDDAREKVVKLGAIIRSTKNDLIMGHHSIALKRLKESLE